MHETAHSFFNIETPTPGSTLPRGRHKLTGWLVAKPGGHFVDVRCRLENRIFPGVHGIPRADLAAYFKSERSCLLAEFYVVVELNQATSEIIFEALDLSGQWSEFARATYLTIATLPPVDISTPSGPLCWHEFGRALTKLLREQRRHPSTPLTTLASTLAGRIPYPRDLRHPHPPFCGHLDEPAAIARGGFGRVPVLGYLFHHTEQIKRVFATFDLRVWQTIEHGRPSPGPGQFLKQYPNASHAGLFGMVDLPAQLPDPVCLRLYAELADGSVHLCSVQRSLIITHEDEKGSYPAKATHPFSVTLTALQDALTNRGMQIATGDELQRELIRLESEFNRRSPQRIPASETALLVAAKAGHHPLPKKILLVTHNLNYEGAPLFLLDYAQYLRKQGIEITVVSDVAGPLGARFSDMGATIQILDTAPIMTAVSAISARTEIQRISQSLGLAGYDLVVANTFTTFWAVQAARQAGCPVLMYVHESTTPANFYSDRVHPEIISLAEEAFTIANAVSFTTESTRQYHLGYGRSDNHRLIPGWIDVSRINDWVTEHSRDSLRTRLKIPADKYLVTNIGTLCERKGQHIFARAIDLLWHRHPDLAARTHCIMLGGGRTAFDDSITDLIQHINRPNLVVHPATADYLPYYRAADLFVCSTYEESSPRVILEAMACGVPIISSDVHGVREQVRADIEATLISPGDPWALCEALAKCLSEPKHPRILAERALNRVRTEFCATTLLPRHAALAAEVASTTI